jgi:hypothetical protein
MWTRNELNTIARVASPAGMRGVSGSHKMPETAKDNEGRASSNQQAYPPPTNAWQNRRHVGLDLS